MDFIQIKDIICWREEHFVALREGQEVDDINDLGEVGAAEAVGVVVENIQ